MSDTLMDFDEAVRRYDPVLGLEVHVELGTATKMFDAAPNVFGAQPNTMVTPTSVGVRHPYRPGSGLRDRAVLPLRPEELLLSGPGQGLPDLPVR